MSSDPASSGSDTAPLDVEALRALCLPVGKPFIRLRVDSLALEQANLTLREKEQVAAAWNALPTLLDRLKGAEDSLAELAPYRPDLDAAVARAERAERALAEIAALHTAVTDHTGETLCPRCTTLTVPCRTFSVASGAVPSVSAEAPAAEDGQAYLNALKWIAHVAAVHYMGDAFEPKHMKALADMALTVIAGDDLPNFEDSMTAARQRGRELWESLGFADDGVAWVDAEVSP